MKKSMLLSIVLISCLLITNTFSAAAETNKAALHKVSISVVNLDRLKEAGLLDEDIVSLAQQIEAYNPTDVQINNYIDDLINSQNDKNTNDKMPVTYERTKSGDAITPYGIVPNYDLSQKWDTPIIAAVSTLSNVINSSDNTGVYYCIRSTAGYNQMTSYAQLPSLSTVHTNDRPYQMFTFRTSNLSTAYGDLGLVYFPSLGAWKGFYNVIDNGTRYEKYDISFSGGSNLYFHVQFYNSTDKVVLTIRDAATWSAVATIEYTFKSDCVKSTFSTTQIAKEVTLAQHNSGTLNITTGTKMDNAKFSQTYLYTPSTYYQFTSTYCADAYRQGPTAAAYSKVQATYTAWTTDNVSISFN